MYIQAAKHRHVEPIAETQQADVGIKSWDSDTATLQELGKGSQL